MIKPDMENNKPLSLLETDNSSTQPKKKLFFTFSNVDNSFLKKKRFNVTTVVDNSFLKKKRFNVTTVNKKGNEKEISNKTRNTYGYWDQSEHKKFIEALYLYNCDWIKIQSYLKNRNYKQIRSHAQKFYLKLKLFKDEKLKIDFTSSDVNSLNDIIKIIEEKESIKENSDKLLFIISEKLSFGKSVRRQERDLINYKKHEADLVNCECKNDISKERNNINLINIINNTNYINSFHFIDDNYKSDFEKFSSDIELKKELILDYVNIYNMASTNNDSKEDIDSIYTIKGNSINDLIFLKN